MLYSLGWSRRIRQQVALVQRGVDWLVDQLSQHLRAHPELRSRVAERLLDSSVSPSLRSAPEDDLAVIFNHPVEDGDGLGHLFEDRT